MSIFSLRRALGSVAAVALAGGMAIAAVPAQASDRPIDITGYNVSSITVADSNCRNVYVSANTTIKSDYKSAYGSVDVTRSGGVIDSLWFEGRKVTDRAFICPAFDGLGTYKIGPADISATYKYWDSYWQSYETGYSDYVDRSVKSFYVRGKTKSSLTATRSGMYVTLNAKAQVYSPEKYRYGQYNAKGAKFQVKSGTTWKTLKTVDLSKGAAKFTFAQSTAKTYRLSIPTATWATSTNSSSVTK